MSHSELQPKPNTIVRVVHVPRRRHDRPGPRVAGRHKFETGDAVRSLTRVLNDGIYPHRDIGEVLVNGGDVGVIRENWMFLGEIYYTVDFYAQAAIVIMRDHELSRAVLRGRVRSAR